jgi:hypothetical protein
MRGVAKSIRSIYADYGTQWQEVAIPPQRSRYRRPKTERSCIEAYPGKDAQTRQHVTICREKETLRVTKRPWQRGKIFVRVAVRFFPKQLFGLSP